MCYWEKAYFKYELCGKGKKMGKVLETLLEEAALAGLVDKGHSKTRGINREVRSRAEWGQGQSTREAW